MLRCVRATRATGLIAGLLALACKKDPPPPPATDAAAQIAATLLAPKAPGPAVFVDVAWPGRGAIEVERNVIEPIEAAIARAIETHTIESYASPGRARIQITATSGTDPFALMTSLRDAMPLRTLPADVDAPVLTRADRDGRVLFAMIDTTTPSRDIANDDGAELDRLADAVAQQPGVWNVRRCGQTRKTLVIQIDPTRIAAFGLGLDQVVEWMKTQVPAATSDIESMMSAYSTSIFGTLRLADITALRVEPREGECVVLGPYGVRPTLEIWASGPGLDAAKKVLDEDRQAARLRTWTVGDPTTPTAIVASTLAPEHQNTIMSLWLADDRATPSWVVRNGDDPGWLLTGDSTMLRSFSRARMVELHVWWPGAPIPVSARICGPELDMLTTTADSLGHAMMNDDLLDDVAVWAPRTEPEHVFRIDREARHGLTDQAIADLERLFAREELRLATKLPIVIRMDPTDAKEVPVRTTAGIVPLSDVGAVQDIGAPTLVTRFGRQRCATVDLQPRRDEDREKIEAVVRERAVLPVGYTLTFAEL